MGTGLGAGTQAALTPPAVCTPALVHLACSLLWLLPGPQETFAKYPSVPGAGHRNGTGPAHL